MQPYREWRKRTARVEGLLIPIGALKTTIIAGSAVPPGEVIVVDNILISQECVPASPNTLNMLQIQIREGDAYPDGVLVASLGMNHLIRHCQPVQDIRHVCSRVESGHPDLNLHTVGWLNAIATLDVIVDYHFEPTQ